MAGVGKKNVSGPTRTYRARIEAGRPNRTFSIAADLDALISELADRWEISRSAVVDLAVRELQKRPEADLADLVLDSDKARTA